MTNHEESHESKQSNLPAVLGGAVVGWLGSWALFAFVTLATFSSTSTDTPQMVLGISALAVLPVVSIAVLLFRRAQGQFAAGMLLGVAIGSVLGAGVCAVSVYPA